MKIQFNEIGTVKPEIKVYFEIFGLSVSITNCGKQLGNKKRLNIVYKEYIDKDNIIYLYKKLYYNNIPLTKWKFVSKRYNLNLFTEFLKEI